jgi:hypothetical protein
MIDRESVWNALLVAVTLAAFVAVAVLVMAMEVMP